MPEQELNELQMIGGGQQKQMAESHLGRRHRMRNGQCLLLEEEIDMVYFCLCTMTFSRATNYFNI